MTIQTMKTTTFEETDYAEWEEIALKSMRGMPFDKLITKTPEGIDLQPLYIADDEDNAALAAIREAKTEAGWIVAQQQYAMDGQAFVAELTNSLERGNDAILYDGTKQLEWNEQSLAEVAKLMTSHPIFMMNTDNNDPLLGVFNLVPTEERSKVRGAVSLANGSLPEGFTNVRTIITDLREVHHSGADTVTELAVAIAQAAEHATKWNTFNEFSEQFIVRFPVDTHFFMEIAKIRAFRVLWQALGTAFGEGTVAHAPVLAETSLRTYSKLDPYVNLLRAGNETLSAVLGGADIITVHPHNVLTGTTTASIRFARNMQLVIKEETLVDKVVDPAGGSYFIETLTKELVEKSWNLFLEIDAQGGYEEYVASGALEQRLTACQSSRRQDASTGASPLVGTNVYADTSAAVLEAQGGIQVAGRLAEPFEQLREHFAVNQPRTVLLTFGELKDFKPRADFVSGFLATGGINAEWSPAFTGAADAIDWFAKETPDYVIVCATPAVTEAVMDVLLAGLPEGTNIDVAGKYDQALSEQWISAGLNGFIYSRQDNIAKLTDIKNRWNGESK